jgi:NAD(P)-dependent dehydrogenase (short-subunit alcohol dehydrogenase family)
MRGPGATGPGVDALVQQIHQLGGEAIASYDSIATPEGGKAVIDTAVQVYGSVDIVVANAGTWSDGTYEAMVADKLDPVLDVKLRGSVFVTQPAWVLMQAKGFGRLIFTSSGVGLLGRHNGANYVAANAGVYGLSRALAIEGAEHRIASNCLVPYASTQRNPKQRVKEDAKEPERVSALVGYLASRECSVSGETFSVGVAGHVSRIFVGVTRGWRCRSELATAESIRDHMSEILSQDAFVVPRSNDELLVELLGELPGEARLWNPTVDQGEGHL